MPLPVQIAAPAAVDPATVLDRVQARRLDRCEQLAIVAAREAWADAGSPEVDPDRLAVVVSSGIGGVASTIAAYDTMNDKGWQRLSPYTVPMLMPNGSAGWIAIELGARAEVHTTVSACASGAEAIGYAIDMIRAGRADVVLAGGTEAAIIPLNVAAFAAMRALSTRNDEPERASRPFDRGRDGFLLGEGAGIVVLESAEHAARRGATVHAIAAGFGYSSDAHHIAQPEPDGTGLVKAIQRALADSGLPAGADRPRQRARHLHPGGGRGRGPGDRPGPRRRGRRRRGVGHQVHDRAPARRGRRGRVGRHDPGAPRAGRAAHHQPGRP